MSLVKKFVYAGRGLRHLIQHELSFTLQCLATLLVVAVGLLVNFSYLAWAIATLIIALVLLGEAFNTVIERLLDILEPRLSTHVRELKDMLAGVIFLVSAAATLIGLFLVLASLNN